MPTLSSRPSAWQLLRQREITCDAALAMIVDEQGQLNLDRLDHEVSYRFFQTFSKAEIPPVVPLLLWQNCYYLGSPVTIEKEEVQSLRDRSLCDIHIVHIATKSYKAWHLTRHADPTAINITPLVNPLTGEHDHEDISETTELYLSVAADQLGRIRTLIGTALRNRASDIHLEPVEDGLRVRYRIDGVLRDITTLPSEVSRRVVVALKVMSNMDIAESRRPQDGRIGEQYTDGDTETLGMDMRVSTLPCVGGEKAVIRLLPRENPFKTVDDLGFAADVLPTYLQWISQPQGMVILTGPTGSGKTSTLYTSLQAIATEQVNIVTVEDPVEYVLPRITQTQVNELAGMTFAAGLRSILRQDPDIIMVGEIRDPETAETAVRAALTGHLVFTTLHTNNAVGAIPRMKDIGPDPGLISDALLGIVAQRLVRRVCPHCAVPHKPTEAELAILGLTLKTFDPQLGLNWRRGTGCKRCFNSGYMGREAIVELLEIDEVVRSLIYDGTLNQLHQYLKESGFITFRETAIAKVTAGITTTDEIKRVLPRSVLLGSSRGLVRSLQAKKTG